TWSLISTILHDSRLHTLFSSDSVPSRHISPRVLFFSYLGLLSLYLTTISSVITPLSLKERLVDRIDSSLPFEFAFNNDTFILETAERKSYELMRVCGGFGVDDRCPGQKNPTDGVDKNSYISGRPGPLGQDDISDVSYYGASVASVFDIEFRNYIMNQHPGMAPYAIGQFRFLETLILTWGYKLIDGLVVEMRHGGVGFRKHALPLRGRNKHGAGCDETLLWMTPETVCEANIVSLEVTKDKEGNITIGLLDMGGFSWKGWERKPRAVNASQPPNLVERAWSGAYYFNEAVAAAVTGKTGMGFHYSNTTTTTTTTAANETVLGLYHIQNITGWVGNLWHAGGLLANNPLAVHRMPLWAKILNGTQAGQTGVGRCAPLVTCGLIIGAANYTEPSGSDSQSNTFPGTFRYPLYTCATDIRASLQKTTFSSKPSKPPLWGVEFYPTLNLTTTEISPVWGPLHPDHKRVANMTVSEGNFLYLPAGQSADEIVDSLSGTSAYQYAANFIYSDHSRLTPGYSGDTNYALYRQWQNVTVNASSAADLPGLVWTDVFANLVTSVSMGGRRAEAVRVSRRVLRYDIRYAAPVLMLLCLWAECFRLRCLWGGR
ncbi:hypothetical protein DFP73DRAFT_483271, partial [Morchella snyderi]